MANTRGKNKNKNKSPSKAQDFIKIGIDNASNKSIQSTPPSVKGTPINRHSQTPTNPRTESDLMTALKMRNMQMT